MSLTLTATLVLAWRPVASGHSFRACLASVALAAAGLALVGGLGVLLWQRQLFAQNKCLGGHALTCYRLAGDAGHFTEEERRASLAHALRQRGCAATQAPACRGLLAEVRVANNAAEVARLELETCLIGDVNDCRPLMRRDLASICSRICAGTTESLLHTCGYCARDALTAGMPALAEAWLAGACARGHGWSCRDLRELGLSRPPGAIAGVTEPPPGEVKGGSRSTGSPSPA